MASHNRTRLTTLTRVVALTALYFLGGLLGKESSFLSGSVALVWPPSGIALAAILLFGYRFWPGIAVGAVLFSTIDGVPLGFFTLGTAVGNTIGAIVCAYLLKRLAKFQNNLGRTRDAANYMLLACALGTTVNAMFNVVSLVYAKQATWEQMLILVSYRAGDQPNNALSLNVLNPGEIAATAGTSGVVYGVADTARRRIRRFESIHSLTSIIRRHVPGTASCSA